MEEKKSNIRQDTLIRIISTDIPGNTKIYVGLKKIKAISWNLSNAICTILRLDRNKRMFELKKEEIEKIEEFLKNPKIPVWMVNRKKDLESGENKHLITTELDLQKEFDIRRMKKVKSYKGVRHLTGLPVRGQRTKAHFRYGKAVGVSKSKSKPGATK